MSRKALWVDVVKGILSTLLMGIGINLFISCELGSDPISVFLDGFHRLTGIEISLTDQVLNGILFLIGYIMNRKLIGINTIVNVLVLGLCIEIPNVIIEPMQLATQGLWLRILAMVVAQLLLATSFAWLQTFKNGISSIDVILFSLMEKTKLKYSTVRIIYDMLFIAVGWLLGGVVGIGTIFSLLTNGYFVEKIRRVINFILEKQEGSVRNERKYS